MKGFIFIALLLTASFASEIIEHYDEDGDEQLNKHEFWEFYNAMFGSEHAHEHGEEHEEEVPDESTFELVTSEEESEDEHSHSHSHEEAECLYPSEFWAIYDTNNDSLFDEPEMQNLSSSIVSMKVLECAIEEKEDCGEISTALKWIGAIISAVVVSLLSLVALILLPISNDKFKQIFMAPLLSFAVGALVGDAILHLIPEALGAHSHDGEASSHEDERAYLGPSCMVLIGIGIFYIVETQLHRIHHNSVHNKSIELPAVDDKESLHHEHSEGDKNPHMHRINGDKHVHTKEGDSKSIEPIGYLSLVADAVHNFVDGLALGGAWASSAGSGIATAIAVVVHEIPQELSDYAILIKAGFSRPKALMFNLLSASTCILGAVIGVGAGSASEGVEPYFLGLIAGGFLYIALADMLHELMHIHSIKSIITQVLFILLGNFVMLVLALWGENIQICLK